MAEVNALYRIFDADDGLLYIGITNNPMGRMMGHLRSQRWARRISYITFEHFNNRAELEAAERKAIIAEGSEFNVTHSHGGYSQELADEIESGYFIEEYGPEDDTYADVDRAAFKAAADVMGKLLA